MAVVVTVSAVVATVFLFCYVVLIVARCLYDIALPDAALLMFAGGLSISRRFDCVT